MAAKPELSHEILEPRDLTSRVCRDEPPHTNEISEASRAAGADLSEWALVHAIVRTLLVGEETCRLYPPGHGRIRQVLKQCLQQIQDYCSETANAGPRSSFDFVVEAAIDLASTEKTRAARDISNFAYTCRTHLIHRISIDSEVGVDEIEQLLRFLARRPDLPETSGATPGTDHEPARAVEIQPSDWTHIRVDQYDDHSADESYRFDDQGDQLFPAMPSSGGGGGVLPSDLPAALRKTLTRVFTDPSVRGSIESLRQRLRLGEESTRDADRRSHVDLVCEIADHLFDDPKAHLDMPLESMTRKVREFVKFLEGMAPSLADSGDLEQPAFTTTDVRDLLRRAAGVQSQKQRGLPEIFAETARLKSIFIRKPKNDSPEKSSEPSEPSEPKSEPPPALEPNPEPRKTTPAEEPVASTQSPPQPSSALDSFTELFCIELDEATLSKRIQRFDYDLAATQINVELMTCERDAERYATKRRRWIDAIAGKSWTTVDQALAEIDATIEALTNHPLEDISELLGDVLAEQTSQPIVDGYFARRIQAGADLEGLRPLLVEISKRDSTRSMHVLDSLWREADKRSRTRFVDEVYFLGFSDSQLCAWAFTHTQAFASERSLGHLRRMPPAKLRQLFEHVLDATSRHRPGADEAASTILKAARGVSCEESLCALALKRGATQHRLEALQQLRTCSSDETARLMIALIERANESGEPDLEAVRLALTALLRSPRGTAQAYVIKVESERKVLRHTYRKEIREILSILKKVERPAR